MYFSKMITLYIKKAYFLCSTINILNEKYRFPITTNNGFVFARSFELSSNKGRDISNAKTRERKLKVLEAAEELKCENLLLITWGTDDMAEYKGHTIKIVSVRNWFYACKLPYILNIPVVTSQKATDTPHPDRWLFIPCSDSVSSARHRTPHCRSRWQS